MNRIKKVTAAVMLTALLAMPVLAAEGTAPALCDSNILRQVASLASTNEETVREAADMVRHGEGALALVRLEAAGSDPSSLRLATAYAILRLSHQLGMLDGCEGTAGR
jgi:hypothetical protein